MPSDQIATDLESHAKMTAQVFVFLFATGCDCAMCCSLLFRYMFSTPTATTHCGSMALELPPSIPRKIDPTIQHFSIYKQIVGAHRMSRFQPSPILVTHTTTLQDLSLHVPSPHVTPCSCQKYQTVNSITRETHAQHLSNLCLLYAPHLKKFVCYSHAPGLSGVLFIGSLCFVYSN